MCLRSENFTGEMVNWRTGFSDTWINEVLYCIALHCIGQSNSFPLTYLPKLFSFPACCIGRFFQCFSLLHNTSKILKTDVPPTAIKTINGMRVISITWVILGHTFANANSLILGLYNVKILLNLLGDFLLNLKFKHTQLNHPVHPVPG